MNFGQKFPYALLTFSQSLSKLIVGHALSQKFVEAGYWPHLFHARTPSPKSLSKLVIGYTIPQSLPARPAPHQLPHPTPTIHPPYTIPQPRPYLSSCELTATKCGKNR